MKPASLLGETFYYLRTTKRWWMLPMIVLFLMFGAVVALSGTAAAPFIYTLF